MTRLDSVITIDCQYMAPEHAAAYLIVEGGRAAFVDNNTAWAVPLLLEALASHGLGPEQVEYVIITHLHLDHAGGTSALMSECPNAVVLAHPRAPRHLADPERLIAGVKAVYGEEKFNTLYGTIEPIDPGRLRAVEDGETVLLGERPLRFIHTLGHAIHHVCIHDEATSGVFTGDSFGVAYNAQRNSARPFLICSSAPTGFDPEQARVSVRKILDTGAERAYLPHFGFLEPIKEAADVLLESIGQMETILDDATASDLSGLELQAFCEQRVMAAADVHMRACGAVLREDEGALLRVDLQIDAQGIAFVAGKRRKA